ncbi:hypothetical protein EX30DRAFT_394246 [Ascodesmis nigricans]|uniref:Uncharacterized protein n=1 Tax=Ascodesmis nigricans TaxID=341454 RepID=A0A4S2N214_9PEZI|nr:hypothetical protein EX30DRAFT_394246 [Ascodesmis nigricans]
MYHLQSPAAISSPPFPPNRSSVPQIHQHHYEHSPSKYIPPVITIPPAPSQFGFSTALASLATKIGFTLLAQLQLLGSVIPQYLTWRSIPTPPLLPTCRMDMKPCRSVLPEESRGSGTVMETAMTDAESLIFDTRRNTVQSPGQDILLKSCESRMEHGYCSYPQAPLATIRDVMVVAKPAEETESLAASEISEFSTDMDRSASAASSTSSIKSASTSESDCCICEPCPSQAHSESPQAPPATTLHAATHICGVSILLFSPPAQSSKVEDHIQRKQDDDRRAHYNGRSHFLWAKWVPRHNPDALSTLEEDEGESGAWKSEKGSAEWNETEEELKMRRIARKRSKEWGIRMGLLPNVKEIEEYEDDDEEDFDSYGNVEDDESSDEEDEEDVEDLDDDEMSIVFGTDSDDEDNVVGNIFKKNSRERVVSEWNTDNDSEDDSSEEEDDSEDEEDEDTEDEEDEDEDEEHRVACTSIIRHAPKAELDISDCDADDEKEKDSVHA